MRGTEYRAHESIGYCVKGILHSVPRARLLFFVVVAAKPTEVSGAYVREYIHVSEWFVQETHRTEGYPSHPTVGVNQKFLSPSR